MLESLNLIFSQQFLIRALVVGVLISLCCALLGVSLVLKRFSMIGDGLSHVGFGAMAIACAANVAPLYFSIPIVLAAAFLLLRMNERGKIKGDAAIALISTGALAVGVMVTSMTTGMNVDIYNYMFGSILTMTNQDVLISSVIAVIIITLFVVFYAEIFSVTFDESFAQATGTKTSVYNMLIAGLTAVTIVIGMRMMGALLISSLIIFPTVTSMRFCKSFRKVVISGAVISVVCFLFGLILSVTFEAPTGASIVCVNIYVLIFVSFISKIKEKIKKASVNKPLSAFLAIIFVALPIVSFSFAGEKKHASDKLSIVATGFAAYDFSREIAGDKGDVYMLLSPGEESHTYEPTPSDIIKIQQCDVFVCVGGESETWVNKILNGTDDELKVVRMMDVTELCTLEHDHSHENEDHSHEGEEYDEHVWTSPVKSKQIVQAISNAIISVDGNNSAFYEENTRNYLSELDELDGKFAALGKEYQGKTVIIGDRFPLRYLMLEYSIDFLSVFPGCSAQAEVNPVAVAGIIEKINSENISTVFKVDMSTGNVANSISEATGTKVDTLYSCHMISNEDFTAGESYISLMNRNFNALQAAIGL